jgi:hypothetical protein
MEGGTQAFVLLGFSAWRAIFANRAPRDAANAETFVA